MIKYKDLTKKSDKEISKLIKDKREALRTFRFGITGSKQKNIKEGRDLRRDIAKLETMRTSKAKTSLQEVQK